MTQSSTKEGVPEGRGGLAGQGGACFEVRGFKNTRIAKKISFLINGT